MIYYGTEAFENFEKQANISIVKAWGIQKEYAQSRDKNPENWLFFVINEDYVFNSVLNPKEGKAFLGGIWVNSNTGEVKEVDSDIRLRYQKAYNGDGKKFPF